MNKTTPRLCQIAAALALAAAGCHSHSPTTAPAPQAALLHYSGSPLSGPESGKPTTLPADSWDLTIDAYLLDVRPRQVLKPFTSASQIVTASGASPLLALPESLADARIDSGDDAQWIHQEALTGTFGQPRQIAQFHAVLAPGLSTRLTVTPPEASPSDSTQLQLTFHRPDEISSDIRVALLKQGLSQPRPDDSADEPAPAPRRTRETAITSIQIPPGAGTSTGLPVAVLVPVEFQKGKAQSVLFFATIAPPSDNPSHQQAIDQAQRDLNNVQQTAQAPSFERLLIESVLKSAQTTQVRRASLAYLATQTQATIFQDMVLVADDAMLQALLDEASPKLLSDSPGDLSAIGWTLDRSAFGLMGRLAVQKKLSPELSAVLTAHTGAAGRSAASLEQLIGRVASRRDLANRLIAENYIFLEDISPAARVAAFDWLKGMGKSPAGYDPLAPTAERQKALEAAIDEMSRTPAGASK